MCIPGPFCHDLRWAYSQDAVCQHNGWWRSPRCFNITLTGYDGLPHPQKSLVGRSQSLGTENLNLAKFFTDSDPFELFPGCFSEFRVLGYQFPQGSRFVTIVVFEIIQESMDESFGNFWCSFCLRLGKETDTAQVERDSKKKRFGMCNVRESFRAKP